MEAAGSADFVKIPPDTRMLDGSWPSPETATENKPPKFHPLH